MKSIKEKSQEVKTELLLNRAKIPEIYEAGANYVFDEIEKTIPSSDDELENHTKCKSAIFRLQSIIEELKKK